MKLKRRDRNLSAESSASSDVAFLLIIYFLVIAGFNINQGFLMNLPAKDSTLLVQKDNLMRFEMDERGVLVNNGAVISFSEAEHAIRAAVAGHPNLAVVLSIDPKAPWQQVVFFVELAQKLQVDSFSFSMKESS
jgi:biopolymer transport protein ExbD